MTSGRWAGSASVEPPFDWLTALGAVADVVRKEDNISKQTVNEDS